jgi:hypothetical protein
MFMIDVKSNPKQPSIAFHAKLQYYASSALKIDVFVLMEENNPKILLKIISLLRYHSDTFAGPDPRPSPRQISKIKNDRKFNFQKINFVATSHATD